VVAVPHKVCFADAVQLDRRQLEILVMGAVDIQPARFRLRLARQEGAIEVTIPADTADDGRQRHGLQAGVVLSLSP